MTEARIDPDLVLQTAVDAARSAGRLLLEGWNRPKEIIFKGEIDLVTQYDKASEKIVLETVRAAFPDHMVVAEEGGSGGDDADYCWYVDPLDGTTNFAHSLPFFCVSIACYGPDFRAGVVFEPLRGELFTALSGRGAFLNNSPISVSRVDDLNRSLLATGFPYDIHERPDPPLTHFRTMCLKAQGLRRAGAAALDLCYVAAGRFEGFWEHGLKPWDTAAGVVLVEEAGGRVSDFSGNPFRPDCKEIIASNGLVHYNMVQALGQG